LFLRGIEKIIILLAQELACVLKYRIGKVTIPGITGEFSKKDVLTAILEELREISWELESVKNRLREIEKTLEGRKVQEVDTELKIELEQSIWKDGKEDSIFLSGEE
jgi:ABC-type long-subunit fatty acid transport system fused permease/ATPase subunit